MNEGKEEITIVLDFLPNGYPFDDRPMYMKTPIAQAVGKSKFTLLELAPKKGIHLQPHEEVYIGEGKRDKIHHIVGRLAFDKLTQTAQAELEVVIKDIKVIHLLALNAYHSRQYLQAIHYWEQLILLLPPEGRDNQKVLSMIAHAERQLQRR